MKKVLTFLILLFTFCNLTAQDHLSFKGIPIEGNIREFCDKLKEKGFSYIGKEENTLLYTGDFTGKTATVGVIATDDGDNVFSVIVFFKPSKEWNHLVSTYEYYKQLYTHKYGKPTSHKENNPSLSDSNLSLMRALEQGTFSYYNTWRVSGGEIKLSIEKTDRVYEGTVMIRYRDTQNSKAKFLNDLNEI